MKRLIVLMLVCALLTGCIPQISNDPSTNPTISIQETQQAQYTYVEGKKPELTVFDNPTLLTHLEESVYTELVNTLDDERYFVEEVSAVYISKEYIEESIYNSLDNQYFGYSLMQLDEMFENVQYIFTLDEHGNTVAQEYIQNDSDAAFLGDIEIDSDLVFACVNIIIGNRSVKSFIVATAKGVYVGIENAIAGEEIETIIRSSASAFLKALS